MDISVDVEAILKFVPYCVALIVALTRFPSRFLRRRHAGVVSPDKVNFAWRWSAAADTLALPVVTLSYAISSVAHGLARGVAKSRVFPWIVGLSVLSFVFFFMMALWVLAANLASDDRELPNISLKGKPLVGYEALAVGVQVAGVFFSAVLDLTLTA